MRKIAFVSLGCDKNTVDSEIMLSLLTEHGYELTKQDEEADAIIINTCAFILDAQEESINTIIEMESISKQAGVRRWWWRAVWRSAMRTKFLKKCPR